MGFSIGGNGLSDRSLFGIQKAKSLLSDSINRISSGNKIPNASFDPVGLTVSQTFRGQIRSFYKAQSNTQDGISLLRTAEGGLSNISDDLNRLRELTIQAGNGAYTSTEIAALENEANQILAGINDTANRTQFNTRNLLDGSTSGTVTSDSSAVEAHMTGTLTKAGSYEGQVSASVDENGNRVLELTLSGGGESRSVTLDRNNRAANALDGVDLQLQEIDSARIEGSRTDFQDTLSFSSAQSLSIEDAGGDSVTVNFGSGNITTGEIVDQLNTDLAGANVDVRASLNDQGELVLAGVNSGEEFSITGASSEFARATGVFDQTVRAEDGERASLEGLNNDEFRSDGLSFQSTVSFNVQDGSGSTATQIDVGGAGVTMTKSELLADINSQLQAGGQRVEARYNSDDQLIFESLDVGSSARVRVEDVSVGSDDLKSALGVSDGARSGSGTTSFRIEASSASLTFQTGANQGQSQDFAFGGFSSGALNLENVDLQTQEGRDDFLGRIDNAVERVSSARSSIGARENRFRSTYDNLSTSIVNSTSVESSIRDADMALESLRQAQQQMKLQSALFAQTQMLDLNKGMLSKIF